jgi:hypothetical protein
MVLWAIISWRPLWAVIFLAHEIIHIVTLTTGNLFSTPFFARSPYLQKEQ